MKEPELQKSSPTAREQAVAAWHKIAELGFGDPAELKDQPDNPLFAEADRLFDIWYRGEKEKVEREGTLEAQYALDFSRTTFYVDAGFHGRDYLDEVANDWLAQDEQALEELWMSDLLADIILKRAEINQLLQKK
jgi:hypothetical protein